MSFATTFAPTKYRLAKTRGAALARRDIRDGSVYVYDDETVRAVNVALVTGRALLLGGRPGSGKSSLAAFVARQMGWNYFEYVMSSRTQAQRLQWRIDEVRRLRDAQTQTMTDDLRPYVEPGVLWWSLAPRRAQLRGFPDEDAMGDTCRPPWPPGELRSVEAPGVLLLDEIDKADPDVPNDILVALGSRFLRVDETPTVVEPESTVPPLVIVTTNRERSLSPAFMRRCIVHRLSDPDGDRLVKIAEAHFPNEKRKRKLFKKVADIVTAAGRGTSADDDVPSIAEYLDAVRACLDLKLQPADDNEMWKTIESAVLQKWQAGL